MCPDPRSQGKFYRPDINMKVKIALLKITSYIKDNIIFTLTNYP